MSNHKSLKNRQIAILAADGFEKVELTIPMEALRQAGAKVDVISLRKGRIRGVNLHEPASRVRVTKTVEKVSPKDYDGLLIPGGFINPDLLRQSAAARKFVQDFDRTRKPIASLCHGPWVLASAGLLPGRTLTSWPGIRDDVVNAGARWLDQDVVRDGNWVTSRGPQDIVPFVKAITELFAETPPLPAAERKSGNSAPQRAHPPQVVLSAMRWTPKPSLRTAISLGALATGLMAYRKVRETF
jgi:protease I